MLRYETDEELETRIEKEAQIIADKITTTEQLGDGTQMVNLGRGVDLIPVDAEQIEYGVYPAEKWEIREEHKDTSWGREAYLVCIGEFKEEYGEVKDRAVIDKTVYEGLKRGEYTVEIIDKHSYNLEKRIKILNREGYRIHHLTGRVYTGLEMGLINKSYETDGAYINKEFINIIDHLSKKPRVYEGNDGIRVEKIVDGTEFECQDGGWVGVKSTTAGGYITEIETEVLPGYREKLMVSKDIKIRLKSK